MIKPRIVKRLKPAEVSASAAVFSSSELPLNCPSNQVLSFFNGVDTQCLTNRRQDNITTSSVSKTCETLSTQQQIFLRYSAQSLFHPQQSSSTSLLLCNPPIHHLNPSDLNNPNFSTASCSQKQTKSQQSKVVAAHQLTIEGLQHQTCAPLQTTLQQQHQQNDMICIESESENESDAPKHQLYSSINCNSSPSDISRIDCELSKLMQDRFLAIQHRDRLIQDLRVAEQSQQVPANIVHVKVKQRVEQSKSIYEAKRNKMKASLQNSQAIVSDTFPFEQLQFSRNISKPPSSPTSSPHFSRPINFTEQHLQQLICSSTICRNLCKFGILLLQRASQSSQLPSTSSNTHNYQPSLSQEDKAMKRTEQLSIKQNPQLPNGRNIIVATKSLKNPPTTLVCPKQDESQTISKDVSSDNHASSTRHFVQSSIIIKRAPINQPPMTIIKRATTPTANQQML